MRTKQTVYGIVGDTGHNSGAEGSLALLQRLGYPFKSGKTGSVDEPEIVVRYFPGPNPKAHFFQKQADLNTEAAGMGLDTNFAAPAASIPILSMMQPLASASLIEAATPAHSGGHGSSNVNGKPPVKKFHPKPKSFVPQWRANHYGRAALHRNNSGENDQNIQRGGRREPGFRPLCGR